MLWKDLLNRYMYITLIYISIKIEISAIIILLFLFPSALFANYVVSVNFLAKVVTFKYPSIFYLIRICICFNIGTKDEEVYMCQLLNIAMFAYTLNT